MPYKTKKELPESVRDALPAHAQEIYKEAYNSAGTNTMNRKNAAGMHPVKRRLIVWPGQP